MRLIICFFGFIVLLSAFTFVTPAYAQTCTPTDPVGAYCQENDPVYNKFYFFRRINNNCKAEDYTDPNTSCTYNQNFKDVNGPQCNNEGQNRVCATKGSICDCGKYCTLLNSLPAQASCCDNKACQSGVCNQATGRCGSAITPTVTPSTTPILIPTPTQVTIPEPYNPSFNSILRQALIVLPILLIAYLLF